MKGIGGNLKATIQVFSSSKNEIGENVKTWTDVQTIKGWLDLESGDSKHNTFHTKIQESTHVFVSDYVALDKRIKAENSRLLLGSGETALAYDILLIDNPMSMGRASQLEFYLKFTGGQ
jgi:hypothetical protein